MTEKKKKDLEKFFSIKGFKICFEYEIVSRYDFDEIVKKLKSIISNNEDCCFDLTGGKELVLTAMGALSSELLVPMLQYDVRTGNLIRVKNCDGIEDNKKASMTIREGIVLNGGEVEITDAEWVFNADFCRDLENIWQICKEDCNMWNRLSCVLAGLDKEENPDLLVRVNLNQINPLQLEDLKKSRVLEKLEDMGLILNYNIHRNVLSFRYKNAQVRRCIKKAGNILELYGYMIAKEIENEEKGYYDDLGIGVSVDWDGVIYERGRYIRDTKNEIDIFLMRDLIPVFVSCKNGEVTKEALYELSAVAEKFGGKYAKKVLLSTTLSSSIGTKKALLQRARDMKIEVIEGVHNMTREELKEVFKSRAR